MSERRYPERERTEEEIRQYEELLKKCNEVDREYAKVCWEIGIPLNHVIFASARGENEPPEQPTVTVSDGATERKIMTEDEKRRRLSRNAIAYMSFNDIMDF